MPLVKQVAYNTHHDRIPRLLGNNEMKLSIQFDGFATGLNLQPHGIKVATQAIQRIKRDMAARHEHSTTLNQ